MTRPAVRRSGFDRFSPKRDVGSLYAKHFSDPTQERRLLSTVGLLSAFASARGVTHALGDSKGPFNDISPGGHQIHHMPFGIAGLLATGYLCVTQIGTG